jgi:hypothetical protein
MTITIDESQVNVAGTRSRRDALMVPLSDDRSAEVSCGYLDRTQTQSGSQDYSGVRTNGMRKEMR